MSLLKRRLWIVILREVEAGEDQNKQDERLIEGIFKKRGEGRCGFEVKWAAKNEILWRRFVDCRILLLGCTREWWLITASLRNEQSLASPHFSEHWNCMKEKVWRHLGWTGIVWFSSTYLNVVRHLTVSHNASSLLCHFLLFFKMTDVVNTGRKLGNGSTKFYCSNHRMRFRAL